MTQSVRVVGTRLGDRSGVTFKPQLTAQARRQYMEMWQMCGDPASRTVSGLLRTTKSISVHWIEHPSRFLSD